MLTGKQKRFLRSLGHDLNPVVYIGKGDITEQVINETARALEAHELIKVKILDSAAVERREAAVKLSESCSAEVAQVLGRTFLLYRKSEKETINLP